MRPKLDLAGNSALVESPPRVRTWISALRYLLGKALTIFATIFAGVFLTLLLANQPSPRGLDPARSPFEISLESQIARVIRISIANGTIPRLSDGYPDQHQLDALEKKLRDDAGLELPFFPRYLWWTLNALQFNWGELTVTSTETTGFSLADPVGKRDLVLEYLPNTLLLIGTAFLLIFLIGMPLSLYLARNYGGWFDRLLTFLSPISSIPSWVVAMLLIALFAVKLRWFPVGGKFDFATPQDPLEYILTLFRHMVLPVSAIVFSMLFQVVYAWRTFFILYSEEDYVDLARAKGLPHKILERQYILKPSLPYVMTSFATIVIGFWQLTVALEAVFQWPGIGWLYIREALPNFWGESMDPGQLMLVIEIVVIFAYLLGAVVFFLDLAYALVDPRIHLLPSRNTTQGRVKTRMQGTDWLARFNVWMKEKTSRKPKQATGPVRPLKFIWEAFADSLHDFDARSRLFFHELRRYPSAMFGVTVISIMLVGSIYAVIGLPYEKYGMEYNTNRVTGRSYTPRLAVPAWTNLFSSMPRLSTLVINEKSPRAQVSLRSLENGWVEKTITFTFDYAYRETPSDIFLYLEPKYVEKFPFISLTWITPDGRDLDLVAKSINAVTNYDFETGIRVAKLIHQNPEWEKWFVRSGQYPTPAINLLFATPHEPQLHLQSGQYQLVLKSLLFEDESDLTAELVLLGQVYGAAGTDYWRRDLVVPLLWGMPFALIIGLLGTLVTILVAMLLPAIGVWYGGWLDEFVQRLTEINMVLPGLMIAVLAYALFGINIWIVLGLVVMMNAFGSPIKTFRSALLQAREAPYIEMARSYGATDFRIITRYLVPRILPVVIPQLVSQIPGFIFLEATLGLFNIKSNYPSWGRIIYDGLARNALYGSPFWVLAPISLLLLTGLAFALLGTALERVLNPRMLEQVSQAEEKEIAKQRRVSKRMIATITAAALLMFFILVPSIKTLSGMFNRAPSTASDRMAVPVAVTLPSATAPSPTETPDPVPQASSTLTFSPTPTLTPSPTILPSLTHTSTPLDLRPKTYTLQAGEFPYCIARRFDIDPIDLLALNGFGPAQTFYTGMTLQIPQNANPFPAQRVLRAHPATYIVIRPDESMGGIACQFGDVDPIAVADANQLAVDSPLFVGQQLHIP